MLRGRAKEKEEGEKRMHLRMRRNWVRDSLGA
jgi:hypothetical protein